MTTRLICFIKQYWFALVLTMIILLLGLADTSMQTLLRYSRHDMVNGELWRILSAHLVHLGWSHLLMNLAGLGMVIVFFGAFLKNHEWLLVYLVSAIATSLLLLQFNPELIWYVGLSGVLHGFFIVGGIADIKVNPKEAYVFLLLIIGKLIWEQISGPLPGSEATAGGKVIVDAHLFGAISGGIAYSLILIKRKLIGGQ